MRRASANLLCLLLLLWTACATDDSAVDTIDTVDIFDTVDTAPLAETLALPSAKPADPSSPQADPLRYTCGYALPGYGCDNGRAHTEVYVGNMQSAVDACRAAKPPELTDFCYVIAAQGGSSSDESLCGWVGGSWRAGTSCCNFLGTVSCPVAAQYRCGYALAGYNCNNGRGSVLLSANNLASAVSACRAARPPSLQDFCYVNRGGGYTANDPPQCAAAGGSWRPASNCCNFKGSVSCP